MKLLFLIYAIFLPVIGVAQQPYNHYTIKNGLPTSTINSIIQDEQGIIWIATNCGAVKYNGQFFRTFGTAKGLKTNDVFDINAGVGERIYVLDYAEDLNYIYHDSIFAVKTGSLRINYVCSYKQLNYFTDNNINTVYVIKGDSFYSVNVAEAMMSAVPHKTGNIRLGTGYPYSVWVDTGKMYTFDIITKSVTSKPFPELKAYKYLSWEDLNGMFIGRYANDLFLFNPVSQKLKQINFNQLNSISYNIKQIVPTRDNIQLTTENGLLVYNRNLELVDSFRINTREQAITSIFEDRRKNIWLVTAGDGLKFIDNYYRATINIPRPEQTAIEFSNGNLYTVDAKGDIIIIDAQGKTVAKAAVDNFSYAGRNFRNVYIQNTYKGTIIATPKNISLVNGLKSTNYVRKVIGGRNDWLQSMKGMCYADKVFVLLHGGIYCLNDKEELSIAAAGKFTKMAAVDSESLWAADNSHLYRLRKAQDGQYAVENFRFQERQLQSLNEPGSMQADARGNLLLTYDDYFVYYNALQNKTGYYKYEHKIKGGKLCNNRFFVYTDGYIDYYFFNKETGKYQWENRFYNFDYSLYEEVKGLAASDSNLYISNNRGLVIMPLGKRFIPDSGFIDKTFIRSVTHRNKIYDSANTANSISLLYTPGQTTFHISSISLSYGRDVSYSYFMDGVDEKWQTSISPDISYTGLPAGHYTFHYIALARKYDLRGAEHTFSIDIEPVWWQRKALRFSGLLLLIGTGFFIMSRLIIARKNKQLRQVLIEKQISDVRLGTLQAQMNPHFVFNALTSVQSFLKQDKNELAGDYLLKFTQLIRLYLEFSRKRFIPLKEEITALRLYTDIESSRFNNKFIVRYQLEGVPNYPDILIPPMIIQPFVENAIIHGLYHKTDGPGSLLLDFTITDSQLTVTVDDNGIGRKHAEEINRHYAKVPSRGNEIVDERIKILTSQDIMQIEEHVEDKTDNNGKPLGTKVTIVFTLNHST